VPLLTAKGGKTHRRRGTIYFWALAVVAITAMVLELWFPILFLAFIAVFSFYFASRGYRVLAVGVLHRKPQNRALGTANHLLAR
jgi:hypothetical protein